MRRTVTVLLVALMGLSLGATAAFADGAQTKAPTTKQKNAIIKAWSGGESTGPAKCYTVQLSKPQKFQALWAGLRFNTKATGCGAAAFDGAAILYGKGNSFYLLTEGSDLSTTECAVTQLVMGPNAWTNLVAYAGAMGCQNID
jgi:hypothetical protein